MWIWLGTEVGRILEESGKKKIHQNILNKKKLFSIKKNLKGDPYIYFPVSENGINKITSSTSKTDFPLNFTDHLLYARPFAKDKIRHPPWSLCY